MSDTQPKPRTSAEIADLVAKAKAAAYFIGEVSAQRVFAWWIAANPETLLRFAATVAELEGKVEKLREALILAHRIANSWIHDQLDGCRDLDDALAELQPAADVLAATAPQPAEATAERKGGE